MPSKKKNESELVVMEFPTVPLSGAEWQGADGKKWMDLAVDSTAPTGLFWIRKRMHDNCYFLVVATVGGHVMKKELAREEAVYLYGHMPYRVPHEVAFGKIKRTKTSAAT